MDHFVRANVSDNESNTLAYPKANRVTGDHIWICGEPATIAVVSAAAMVTACITASEQTRRPATNRLRP